MWAVCATRTKIPEQRLRDLAAALDGTNDLWTVPPLQVPNEVANSVMPDGTPSEPVVDPRNVQNQRDVNRQRAVRQTNRTRSGRNEQGRSANATNSTEGRGSRRTRTRHQQLRVLPQQSGQNVASSNRRLRGQANGNRVPGQTAPQSVEVARTGHNNREREGSGVVRQA
uniref:B2-like protein n=1 Tax=Lutzomyia nodavirus TaxID=1670671 RepID=A0A0H4LWF8_9VIRU|nr:B2-like protein [Lutzomyia nodavirus]